MKKLSLWLLVILVLSSFCLIGCNSTPNEKSSTTKTTATTTSTSKTTSSTSTTVANTIKTGGIMKVVLETSPGNAGGWPYDLVGDAPSSAQVCIEPLLRMNSKAQVEPSLALSYSLAEDRKSITFQLRKGVKFHDGTDFNAKAAKWNLDNTIASKTQPYWESVDIIDDYSVRVNFKQWVNTLLNGFCDGVYSWMISPTAFEKNGKDWMRDNPTGTGPFKFVSFQKDVAFKATKNPDYWGKNAEGKQLPYLDGVEIAYVSDPLTRKAVMQSGSGYAVPFEPGKAGWDYKEMGLVLKTSIVTTFVLMGDTVHEDSPFSNQKVREAVEYAIDREALAKAFSFGFWKAPYQIPGQDTPVWDPNFSGGRKFDVTKAKQLMQEAGFTNGFTCTLMVMPSNIDRSVTLAIQNYLAQINITVNLDYPDMGRFQSVANSDTTKSLLVFLPVSGQMNYNSTFSYNWTPGSNMSKGWLRTPEFIAAFNATMNSRDPDVKLMREVTNTISRQASLIPVIEAGKSWAIQPFVKDEGFFERSFAPWWKPEQTWLSK